MEAILSTAAFVLALGATAPYLWAIYTREARTTLSTWIAWTIMNAVILAGMLSSGEISWQVTAFIIANSSIVAMSLYRGAKITLTKLDLGGLGLTLVACVLWAMSGNPLVAVLASVGGMTAGAIPMIVNMARTPNNEVVLPWIIQLGASVCALTVALSSPSVITLAPPIFFLCMQLLLVALISRKFLNVGARWTW